MAGMWLLICLSLIGIIGRSECVITQTETFYLDEICGNTIDMPSLGIESGRLLLRRYESALVNFNCVVLVQAPLLKTLIFKVKEVDIVAPFGCARDYVQFFDGKTSSKPLSNGVCGNAPPDAAFITTETSATVAFGKKLDFMNDQFEIIFTGYRKGPCEEGEFSCRNGLCVSNKLHCDGYDNCGDASDVCLLTVSGIIGVAVAVAIVIVIVALVIAVVLLRRRRQKLEKWHKLNHTYSFNGSSSMSLPRSRKDYALPRRVQSFTVPGFERSSKHLVASSRWKDDSAMYATVLRDEAADHKMHVLNAATLANDFKPKRAGLGHVMSFRTYPAPVPVGDAILRSSPVPSVTNGWLSSGTGSLPMTEVKSSERPVQRQWSSRSVMNTKFSSKSPRNDGLLCTEIPIHLESDLSRRKTRKTDMTADVPNKHMAELKSDHDIEFHNDTAEGKSTHIFDRRESFDFVHL